MNNDKLNNFIQFVINYLLMPIAIIFLLVICLIIFATTSHAASDQDYFPMEQNKNGNIPDNILTFIENNYNDQYYYICYYQYREENSFTPGTYYYYYFLVGYNKQHGDNPLYCEINNDLIHFSLYNNSQNGLFFRRLSYFSRTPNNITAANTGSLSNFQNLVSSNYDTSKDYVSNFTVYTSNNTSSRKVVLLSDGDVYIPEGDIVPGDMEKPDINDYIPDWSNTPTFDSSTVESSLQSVFNGVIWFGNNIKGTISGTGHFISDSVSWGLQRVVDNIRSKIDEIKTTITNSINGVISIIDNIKGTINNIKVAIDYIGEPINTAAISTAISQNGLISVKNDYIDFFNDFDDIIRNTSEPDTFDIIINVQNVRTFYNFGVRSPVVLHLGNNLNGTLKTTFRVFLWVLVIVGSIFLTEKNLSAWIKGGGFSDK